MTPRSPEASLNTSPGTALAGTADGAPSGARHLATLDLAAPGGARWVERFWLLRQGGLDSLWTARPDGTAQAELAVAADTRGEWRAHGSVLLAGYLAGRRVRVQGHRRRD
jgi:hypothetical protein